MKNNTLHRNGIFAPTAFLVLAFTSHLAFAQSTTQFVANRLNNSQPIIDQAMFAAVGAEEEGENINGPSLIRIPDWIPPSERVDPSAVYYLYFAHHAGDYIRLAWATEVEGPWTFYQTGSQVPLGDRGVLDNGGEDLDLGLGVVIEENHLASPDVLIDDENQQIIMYFHSGSSTFFNGNEQSSQNTWVSTSDDGLEFSITSGQCVWELPTSKSLVMEVKSTPLTIAGLPDAHLILTTRGNRRPTTMTAHPSVVFGKRTKTIPSKTPFPIRWASLEAN